MYKKALGCWVPLLLCTLIQLLPRVYYSHRFSSECSASSAYSPATSTTRSSHERNSLRLAYAITTSQTLSSFSSSPGFASPQSQYPKTNIILNSVSSISGASYSKEIVSDRHRQPS